MGNKESNSSKGDKMQPTNAEIEAQEGMFLSPEAAQEFGLVSHIDPSHHLKGPPTQVLDYLYLGSSADDRDHELMDSMGVGWVLNAAEECGNLYPHKVHF